MGIWGCWMGHFSIKILKSERKIDELLEIVTKLERKVNKEGQVEETGPKGNNPVPEIKPRRKTRWEPIDPSIKSSLTVEPFVKYFVLRVEEGKKRAMCIFQIETDLANQLGDPAESIRGGGRDSFLGTVYSENQSNKMKRVEQIAGNKCQVSEENFLNTTKGLVYIQNYHIEDLKSFTEGVYEQCRVKELVEAKWIKHRRETTQVFMITFKNDKLPNSSEFL